VDRKNLYLALLLFAATVLTVWAFVLILSPFLVPIAWAMCLLTVTSGLYARLERRTGRPRLSAFLMTVGVALAVLLPLAVVGLSIVREAKALATKTIAPSAVATTPPVEPPAAPPPPPPAPFPGEEERGPAAKKNGLGLAPRVDKWDEFFRSHEGLGRARDKVDEFLRPFDTDLRSLVQTGKDRLLSPLATGAVGVLQSVFQAGFGFLMMLATLYFLYRDGGRIRAFLVDLVPLGAGESDRVLETLRSTAFAAIVGGILTALIQGALGGLAFAIVGVEAPVLWGFVMAVLSLLPIGGSAFVWAPAMVYFFVVGPVWKAWFLLVWGVAVIGSSDNLLRPWLMRKAGAAEIHPLLLFFAILSGIGLFGPSGIVFGPLLVAAIVVVAKIYRDNFGAGARAAKTAAR
jgi:predicted PurR-regulated permease PerM